MPSRTWKTPHIASNDKQLLYFSRNSSHNTVITGSGRTYNISSTPFLHKGPYITSVYRTLDSKTDADETKELIAEIHWRVFGPTTVRMVEEKGNSAWVPLKEFLRKQRGGIMCSARTFSAANGKQYRWKMRGNHLIMCRDSDPDPEVPPVAMFYRPKRNIRLKTIRSACLEILPEAIDSLDVVIVTFLITEQKRKERERRIAASTAGH